MKTPLTLPPHTAGASPTLPDSRQITLVGAAGAGKSRFMDEMRRLCGEKAFTLSALDAACGRTECVTDAITGIYHRATTERPYMRNDASTPVDRLVCLLLTDEFEHLLDFKSRWQQGRPPGKPQPTRLDRLRSLWEGIFPTNRIVKAAGSLRFRTAAGSDLVDSRTLSRGEQTVFYHIAAMLYAPRQAVVFVEDPTLFVHPAVAGHLWDAIEKLRPDCRFVYDTVDVDFVNSRTANTCIWVKSYDAAARAWDYETLPSDRLSDDLFIDLIGTRKPVLFIEGDAVHSIDSRLYSLVFTDFNVRPLGSCDKVIETTRSFRDLRPLHRLDSRGIVDRDRRTDEEVAYLRRKGIDVPEVAEVENIFLVPGVIQAMARHRQRPEAQVSNRVRSAVMKEFARQLDAQALQHVRHRVKRQAECRIDARFTCITAMELHLSQLVERLAPRRQYEALLQQFRQMVRDDDYLGVLRVFNHKPMLAECGVAEMLGYHNRDEYITGVLRLLRAGGPEAQMLAAAVRALFTTPQPENTIQHTPRPKRYNNDVPCPDPKPARRKKHRKGKKDNNPK